MIEEATGLKVTTFKNHVSVSPKKKQKALDEVFPSPTYDDDEDMKLSFFCCCSQWKLIEVGKTAPRTPHIHNDVYKTYMSQSGTSPGVSPSYFLFLVATGSKFVEMLVLVRLNEIFGRGKNKKASRNFFGGNLPK